MKIWIDENGTTLGTEDAFTRNVVLARFPEDIQAEMIDRIGIGNNVWTIVIPFPRFTPTGKRARYMIDLPYWPHIKQNIKFTWDRMKKKLNF